MQPAVQQRRCIAIFNSHERSSLYEKSGFDNAGQAAHSVDFSQDWAAGFSKDSDQLSILSLGARRMVGSAM